jgi:hypothetical protein
LDPLKQNVYSPFNVNRIVVKNVVFLPMGSGVLVELAEGSILGVKSRPAPTLITIFDQHLHIRDQTTLPVQPFSM